MLTAPQWIRILRELGAVVEERDGKVRIDAPAGLVGWHDDGELRALRIELLAVLRAEKEKAR